MDMFKCSALTVILFHALIYRSIAHLKTDGIQIQFNFRLHIFRNAYLFTIFMFVFKFTIKTCFNKTVRKNLTIIHVLLLFCFGFFLCLFCFVVLCLFVCLFICVFVWFKKIISYKKEVHLQPHRKLLESHTPDIGLQTVDFK